MTDPGRLNRRLQLIAPSESEDDEGGVIRSDQVIGAVWAAVTPGTVLETPEADADGANLRMRIVIRSGAALSRRHRLVDGGNVYRIVAVSDSTERGFTEIDAMLRVT